MKNKLKNFLKLNSDGKQKFKKRNYLILIALIGLLLLLIGNLFNSSVNREENLQQTKIPSEETIKHEVKDDTAVLTDVSELETTYEKELTTMLNKIDGVSEVEVMINLDSTNVKIYERNLIVGQQTTDESDKNGGLRKIEDHTEETQIVFIRQGDQEVPLVVQTRKPEVRGVFIVAKGADHATVKKWITEATARVLDVPTHRVSVMPKN